jgi:DNA polymerase-3 subunit gamma/tau
MLSKAAFNALLKTLEEPPGRVAFILATTEPHKFPPTIVSRCQHYIFQRLTRKEIAAHLEKILQAEGVEHEAEAVKLLARRGAGSVRDAMSLMGQVLALGGERLEAADARRVLGLAGQEVFFRLMEAVHARDCVAISKILREVLDQGLDIGFFLSELIQVWRNLFILSQSGEKGFEVLDVPEEDAARWLQEWVPKLSLAHIHACWQLTLEGQQRVRASLDPSLALELLLLNLAFLPRLVPMRELEPPKGGGEEEGPADRRAPRQEPPPEPAPEPGRKPAPQAEANEDREPGPEAESTEEKSWQGFLDFVAERAGNGLGRDLAQARGNFGPDGVLVLDCENGYVGDRLSDSAARRDLEAMAVEYFGEGVRVEVKAAKKNVKSREDREREAKEHPVVQAALRELDAGILGVDPQGK